MATEHSHRSETASYGCAGLVGSAYGSLAEEAAAHLGKSTGTVESIIGSPKEIRRQADDLVVWAVNRGVLLNASYRAGLEKHQGETSEHDVFYRQTDNRAVKYTHPGAYGFANGPRGKQRPATPLFYLQRLTLMNRVFGASLRLEGISFGKPRHSSDDGERPCIVVSQDWVEAANEDSPHPTEQEISSFMVSLGFSRLEHSCYQWRRASERLVVFDTKPDNFINSSDGVVPIDLLVGHEIGEG